MEKMQRNSGCKAMIIYKYQTSKQQLKQPKGIAGA